jgi:hypothetical protein
MGLNPLVDTTSTSPGAPWRGSPSLVRLMNASIPREFGEKWPNPGSKLFASRNELVTPVAALLSVSMLMNP